MTDFINQNELNEKNISSINLNENLSNSDQNKPILYTESKPKRKSRIIKWDEVTIEEHNKERGTRQKIDEPPTPYRYSSESDQSEAESIDSNGSHRRRHAKKKTIQFASNNDKVITQNPYEVMNDWKQLHAKLNYENFKQSENNVDDIYDYDEMSIDESPNLNSNANFDDSIVYDSSSTDTSEKHSKKEFNEKRMAHYNEFKILQALKNKLSTDEDSDEES